MKPKRIRSIAARHIGTKLFAGFLCMAVLTVGIVWLILAVITKDSYRNERIRAIDTAILNVAQDDIAAYPALEESSSVSLLAVDGAGHVAYMSQGMPMRGMILRQIESILGQNANGVVKSIETAAGTRYAVLGRPLPGGGTLYAVFSLADVEEAAGILLNQLWIVTAALLAVSIVFAIVFARAFSRPIKKVTQAARAMAAGCLDISLPVKSEDEIGQLTMALNDLGADLQKTESLRRELIANVSHELRSPLSVIQGFAETVRDVTWPDEQKRAAQLTMIADEASRLGRIVNDILDYSRLQAGMDTLSVADFPICPMLKELLERHEQEARTKNIRFELICGAPLARFDKDRFAQVLDNLINNALSHADKGSSITICVQEKRDAHRISVRNTGVTIPDEALLHIWDRYYRADTINGNKPLGTGLGLSIVKSILDKHGVSYGVTSKGNVTEFWFDTLTGK